jgi:hypothetical protein
MEKNKIINYKFGQFWVAKAYLKQNPWIITIENDRKGYNYMMYRLLGNIAKCTFLTKWINSFFLLFFLNIQLLSPFWEKKSLLCSIRPHLRSYRRIFKSTRNNSFGWHYNIVLARNSNYYKHYFFPSNCKSPSYQRPSLTHLPNNYKTLARF